MPFQDDLSTVVLERETAACVEECIRMILKQDLWISVSTKPEAKAQFAERFEETGAEYDTSNIEYIKCRPWAEKLKKLEDMRKEVQLNQVGKQ